MADAARRTRCAASDSTAAELPPELPPEVQPEVPPPPPPPPPPPSEWRAVVGKNGEKYYWNPTTNETTWSRPQ
jgi:hypothetical protein